MKKGGQGKLDVRIGNFSFSGEGEQDWLAKVFDKVLQAAITLGNLGPAPRP